MAAPRPKKTAVKKKPPVKKAPKPKKPSFPKKDTPRPARDIKPGDLRSQTLANDNTPRPAKDLKSGGLRAQHLQEAKNKYNTARNNKLLNLENKNKETRRRNKITKFRIKSLDSKIDDLKKVMTKYESTAEGRVATPKTGLLRGVGVVLGAASAIVDPSFMSNEYGGAAGPGSTVPGQAQKAVQKKMKREIRQGPKLAVTGVKEGTTRRLAPTGSRKPAPGANYSGQSSTSSPFSKGKGTASLPKVSGDALRKAPAGTYTASYDVKANKSSPANTAATAAAAAGSKGGSKAAKAGGSVTNVSKAKVGRLTRYQRNETAMEQKRSSSRPKKSIFSLFRKG